MSQSKVYSIVRPSEFQTARHSGRRIEVDEDTYWFYLEVLPPASMGKTYTLDGIPQRTNFGFADGTELITAFWKEYDGSGATRYFCQMTDVVNPW